MNNRYLISLFILLFLSLSSCIINHNIPTTTDDGIIEFQIIQLNDVYEIAPIQNGAYGGMARVAQYIKDSRLAEENLLTVLSGDFLNPSLLGTIKVDGKRIKGEQMIDLMNAATVDLVTLGNHEFDLKENELQERINESEFDWISTDIWQICGDKHYPFYKEKNGKKEFFPETYHWNISDKDGTTVSVGFFSATIASNPIDYVYYGDYTSLSLDAIKKLKNTSDIVIGITHLEIDQDLELAALSQDVPLFIGGHDHDNMIHTVGNTRITKADANAKTIYVHYFTHNKNTGITTIKSELVEINKSIPEEANAAKLVKKWMDIQEKNLKLIIDNPYEVIYTGKDVLDGRESTIRNGQTNMGAVFTSAMLHFSSNKAEASILNSGSIRIDDQIGAPIVALDIFRALPFGGKLADIDIKGELLKALLIEGENSNGSGAYLQYKNIQKNNNGEWLIGNRLIEDSEIYSIVINDFLLMGRDIKFLTRDNPGIIKITDAQKGSVGEDIRKVIIEYMKIDLE